MSDDTAEVKLIRIRLHGLPVPATAYYLAQAREAGKAAEGARQNGDQAEVLDPATFAAAAALAPTVGPLELRLVGIQVGRVWVQPPSTGQAASRN